MDVHYFRPRYPLMLSAISFHPLRLNFDYDSQRGTDDGPWNDGIPFDGRDIWQVTLVADDSMKNMWRVDPTSFVNLGANHQPRCWPWSKKVVLPYERYVRLAGYTCPLFYAATLTPLLATHKRIGRENDAPTLGVGPNGKGSSNTMSLRICVRALPLIFLYSTRCSSLHQVGAVSVHICLGPHGCCDNDHPHSLPAQAA